MMKSPHNKNKKCNNKLASCQRQEILKEAGRKSQAVNNCETETRAMRATQGGYCLPNAELGLTQPCFQNKNDRGRFL